MLNNIVDNYEQYMGSTTLLHPVFNNLEQVIIFCRVTICPFIFYMTTGIDLLQVGCASPSLGIKGRGKVGGEVPMRNVG